MADGRAEVVVDALPFLVSFNDEDDVGGGQKGIFGRDRETVIREIPVEVLRRNLRHAIDGLREIFDDIADGDDELPLKEAQISFEVTASGAIAVLGTSAELAGRGAITLTFGR